MSRYFRSDDVVEFVAAKGHWEKPPAGDEEWSEGMIEEIMTSLLACSFSQSKQ